MIPFFTLSGICVGFTGVKLSDFKIFNMEIKNEE